MAKSGARASCRRERCFRREWSRRIAILDSQEFCFVSYILAIVALRPTQSLPRFEEVGVFGVFDPAAAAAIIAKQGGVSDPNYDHCDPSYHHKRMGIASHVVVQATTS